MKKIYSLIIVLFFALPLVNAQSIQEKQEIKNHFRNGNAPGAIHFAYLIDACYNYSVGEGLLYDSANNLLQSEVPLSLLENSLRDTAITLRQERNAELNLLKNSLSSNEFNLSTKINDLENRMRTELSDTSFKIRSDVKESLMHINNLKTNELLDTAKAIRFDMNNQFQFTNAYINDEIVQLNSKVDNNYSEFKDSTLSIRNHFEVKLLRLETALNDSTQVLRKYITDINSALILKMDAGDKELGEYVENYKVELIKKIDSLAEVHNLDRIKHENRMSDIEQKHSVLSDTVYTMKKKLDTLNYTEKNFTNTLKQKLDNIEDGATRSDNNFTDELKTKLDGIENSANNYQLPLGTHSKLGGIQLSQDFVIYKGKAYNAMDANKIDRQYATDTIVKNWTSEMKDGDQWTRVRYKMENGLVDADGNKLYDYGEWNQAYKFIYDDLETSYYEFNATDSLNVILGIHEKDKQFNGKDNTLLGHNAGYTLYKGGERNVLVGKFAGRSSENISDNVFIGNQAGESIGDPNVAGNVSGEFKGERNVALGSKAMQGRNATGKSVAVGFSAMELGEQNSGIAIGYKAAAANSGTNNVAIGYEAGLSKPGSNNSNNIIVGYRSGYNSTYTKRNVFVGDSAAFNNESGKNNVVIGHGAGCTNKGSKNVIIGNDIDVAGDSKLAIGNSGMVLISGDFNTKSVSIDKLATNELTVANSNSNYYSVSGKKVIDNTGTFVGEGGVNTSGQIISSYANAKSATASAISAPNGSVSAKYLLANQSIQIGAKEVLSNTAAFVGDGGVNTIGSIKTSGEVNAKDITSTNATFSEKLVVAGIDIVKVSGSKIEERYAENVHSHNVNEINTNSTNQFVSQSEKNAWNNKVDKVSGKDLSSNDFTNTYKSKLDGVASEANKYVHPSKHSADMITQDGNHRFVSDMEKANWNNKANRSELSSNDYTNADKSKLAGIQAGANHYTHPATHSADMIATNTNKQFVSQAEKDSWTTGQIPVGGIIMWNGTTVPDGWALCNGQTVNGKLTPDLRGRFIVGSYPGKGGFAAGNSGGSIGNSPSDIGTTTNGNHSHAGTTGGYKLKLSDMPAHKHKYKNYYYLEDSGKDDERSGSDYGYEYIEQGVGSDDTDGDNTRVFYKKMDTYEAGSNSPNTHTHSISSDGNHDHKVSVPYYVLAFIMRVK
ncbi:tail fiber protein [Marinifilum sp. D737]|uniref:tail fiber protein n=1 Tax=Marinifilum sp. D737 TaxID=2969628 RepID=UPI002274C98D|nr:tail fiber protein [Marinifilum sp. D737]MCY1635201.1 tail fiber protein [Marinifilum sp. D737]